VRARRIAIEDESRKLCFADALADVELLARALAAPPLLLGEGMLLGVMLGQDADYVIAQLAAARLGCGSSRLIYENNTSLAVVIMITSIITSACSPVFNVFNARPPLPLQYIWP
jgi:hypothetical protein